MKKWKINEKEHKSCYEIVYPCSHWPIWTGSMVFLLTAVTRCSISPSSSGRPSRFLAIRLTMSNLLRLLSRWNALQTRKLNATGKKQTDKRVETLWMRWKMPDPITGAEKCKYGLFIFRRPLFCPHISISFVHFYADVISPLFSDAEHGFMRCWQLPSIRFRFDRSSTAVRLLIKGH